MYNVHKYWKVKNKFVKSSKPKGCAAQELMTTDAYMYIHMHIHIYVHMHTRICTHTHMAKK